jgi:hypothetical protein
VLNKKLLLVLVALLPCYSYSDSLTPYYGNTGNAAQNGLYWNMDNVFPADIPGLDVQNVIYNYTIHKQIQDQVDVTVQNENALGTGYIFQETDRWMPGSIDGLEINKVVPVMPNINREFWGDGSIEVQGNGSVSDANVVYTYRVDPCYDPQYNPSCTGYEPPLYLVPEFKYEPYDFTADAEIKEFKDQANYQEEEEMSDEEKAEKEAEEKKESKERLEKALSAANSSVMFAQGLAQSQMLDSLNRSINMNSYYTANIQGGVYKENVVLSDKKLPENKKGLRNGLAQQILHDQMIEMQYK